MAIQLPGQNPDEEPNWEKILDFLKPKPIPYCPHVPFPKQQAFLRTEVLEALYGGSASGGKSDALLMGALQYVDVPGYAALLFRNTYADLSLPGALMDRAMEWWSEYPEIRFDRKTSTFHFPAGSSITFGYLQGPDDHLRYKGPTTEDHDILTENGWISIAKAEVGQRVATMNPETRVMEFKPITHTQKFWYEGELIKSYEGSDVSFSYTPDHTVWLTTNRVRDRLRRFKAEDIPTTARFAQWANWIGETPPTHFRFEQLNKGGGVRDDAIFEAGDFAEFLGWFIAEGSHSKGTGNWIKISQHDLPGSQRQRILDLLSRSGVVYWSNHRDIQFSIKGLIPVLDQCGHGAKEKRIPRQFLNYNTGFLKRLLYSLVEGDGTWRKKDLSSGHFVTTSPQLADDVMELAVRCGYRATLNERPYIPEHNFGLEGMSYHVHLHDRKGKDTIFGNAQQRRFRREPYEGYVYCVTVPPYHTVLTRHNGRIHWTGNSEVQYVAFDELTEIREQHYRYLLTRLRKPSIESGHPLARVPLRARAATNPAPNWVRRYFIEEGPKYGRIFIPAGLDDNAYVDRESYAQSLERASKVDYLRLAKGDWYAEESGNYFDRSDFEVISPEDVPPEVYDNIVRYWDLAGSEVSDINPDPDYSAGVKAALLDGILYVLDIRRFREGPMRTEMLVRQTADEDGVAVKIRMDQDPGQAGKALISHYARNVLLGYDFAGNPTTKEKAVRAGPWMAKVKRGEVKLVRGNWITEFLDEATSFGSDTKDLHDDQIDSLSGAFEVLAGLKGKQRTRVKIIV